MIYVTRFDILSTLKGAHASRVHTKYIFTAHAMTNAEKEALTKVYIKEYTGGGWTVQNFAVDGTVIEGGENE